MVLEVIQLGNPILRIKTKKISRITDDILELRNNMIDTMHHNNGVGIAAPQVNVSISLAVIDTGPLENAASIFKINNKDEDYFKHLPLTLINPKLTGIGKKELGIEGCLSIKDIRENVKRYDKIEVIYNGLYGNINKLEVDGMISRVIQHEVDHLNGILFIDKLNSITKNKIRNQLKILMKQ